MASDVTTNDIYRWVMLISAGLHSTMGLVALGLYELYDVSFFETAATVATLLVIVSIAMWAVAWYEDWRHSPEEVPA